jgi:hypothetical protein
LVNEPSGRIPGVYEVVAEPFRSALPKLSDEDRQICMRAASLCGGKRGV